MKNIYKQYISDIKTLFPSWRKDERNYVSKFKQNLLDNIDEESVISKEDLYRKFGRPKEVVDSYYENIDIDATIKQIKTSKYIRYFIFIIILCALICTSAFAFNMYQSYKMFEREEAVFVEEEIDDYNENVTDGEFIK